MSATQSRRTAAARIFSPFAYVAVLLAASLAAPLTVRTLKSVWGDGAPGSLCAGADLLIAGTVLYTGGLAMLRSGDLPRPGIADHLRRCAVLYASFVPGSVLLVAFANSGDPGGGGALAIMLCSAAGYAILVDAVLLFGTRRRLESRGFGGRA